MTPYRKQTYLELLHAVTKIDVNNIEISEKQLNNNTDNDGDIIMFEENNNTNQMQYNCGSLFAYLKNSVGKKLSNYTLQEIRDFSGEEFDELGIGSRTRKDILEEVNFQIGIKKKV